MLFVQIKTGFTNVRKPRSLYVLRYTHIPLRSTEFIPQDNKW